jgi:hypothetical protein
VSPAEFPLKAGQWKSFLKKAKKAEVEAGLRAPCKPGEKVQIRKKKVRIHDMEVWIRNMEAHIECSSSSSSS